MTINVKIENAVENASISMEIDGTDTAGDIISMAAQYWGSDPVAYVMRIGNRLVPVHLSADELKLKDGDVLVMVPDPQGG